jgi:enamine deaminase RidA (YjgF/YER057c/UK114 family)
MTGRIDTRLAELGLTLPQPAAAVANYIPYVVTGNLVFVSGQLPLAEGKLIATGKLGDQIDVEQGYAAARQCGLNLLAQARAAAGGDLDKVRLVRLTGFVACVPGFTDQPKVINGTSDLMVEVLGEAGRHARVAVGAPSLPLDAAVEVDAVFELTA